MRITLSRHPFHAKTDAELRYIVRDAGEAARAMEKHNFPGCLPDSDPVGPFTREQLAIDAAKEE